MEQKLNYTIDCLEKLIDLTGGMAGQMYVNQIYVDGLKDAELSKAMCLATIQMERISDEMEQLLRTLMQKTVEEVPA